MSKLIVFSTTTDQQSNAHICCLWHFKCKRCTNTDLYAINKPFICLAWLFHAQFISNLHTFISVTVVILSFNLWQPVILVITCVCISMSEGRRYGMCLISGAQCQCNLFFLIHGNFDSIQLIQSASGINLEGLRADRAGLFILCWFYVGILLGLKINAAKTKTKKVLERSRTQDWTHSWQNNEKTTPQSLHQCHWPSFSLKKKKTLRQQQCCLMIQFKKGTGNVQCPLSSGCSGKYSTWSITFVVVAGEDLQLEWTTAFCSNNISSY